MTRSRLGLCLAWLLAAASARADDDIARRLGALKALVRPGEARRVAAEAPPAGSCPSGTWWRLTDYGVRSRIDTAVRDASLRYAIDPDLLHAVIRHESNYQVRAVSYKGAQGLMQLMPQTARSLGVADPLRAEENVDGGVRYLRGMLDRFDDVKLAVAAYNAGPEAVDRYGGIPPYRETRDYVKRVLTYYESYHGDFRR